MSSNTNAKHCSHMNMNHEPESSILTDLINKSKDTENGNVVVKRSVMIEEHTTFSKDDLMKLKGQYENSCSKYGYKSEKIWMKEKLSCLNGSDLFGFDGDNHYVDTLSFHLLDGDNFYEDLHRWGNPIVEF
jgi:hypothetical protein